MVKVTVISLAFNQEKFIRQTLDGFVMQKTDFPFEVHIHDDASTDGTVAIIKEYAQKYPEIIKPILEIENQYSKGTYEFVNEMMRKAKGDYIAYCEGDDYWTDEHKLQLQVDFLDAHKDYSVCFHPVKVIFEDDAQKSYLYPQSNQDTKFTARFLLESNFIQTNSVMYRRQSYANLPVGILPQDWYMHLYHAKFGKIGYIDKAMAVYRRHAGGIWWEAAGHIEIVWKKFGLEHLALYAALLKLYGGDTAYRNIIYMHVSSLFDSLSVIDDDEDKSRLLIRLSEEIPDAFEFYMSLQTAKLVDQQKATEASEQREAELLSQLKESQRRLEQSELTLAQKNRYIDELVNSKSWKITKPLRSANVISKKIHTPAKPKDPEHSR